MATEGIPQGTRKQHYPSDSTQKRNIIKVMLQSPSYGWKRCLWTPFRSVGLELGSAFDG